MLELFSVLGGLIRMFPSLAAGGVPTTAMPGDTDGMAHVEPSAPPLGVMPAPSYTPSIDRVSMRLGPGQYMQQETAKRQIVLHFTAGSTARGAFDSWVRDSRTVATAFIVDLNGTIYETFDPRYWAFALGVKGGLARPSEQAAIQIEIVGWGPLKRVGGALYSWPKNWGNRYCGVEETSKYVRKPFRGIDYFSDYPSVQFEAVAALCRYLCQRFEIPADIPPADFRGVCNVSRANLFRGVVAHENYRQDKWDVGPAWDWARFEQLIRRAS